MAYRLAGRDGPLGVRTRSARPTKQLDLTNHDYCCTFTHSAAIEPPIQLAEILRRCGGTGRRTPRQNSRRSTFRCRLARALRDRRLELSRGADRGRDGLRNTSTTCSRRRRSTVSPSDPIRRRIIINSFLLSEFSRNARKISRFQNCTAKRSCTAIAITSRS